MAISAASYSKIVSSAFECRSDPDFSSSPRPEKAGPRRFAAAGATSLRGGASAYGLSSLIFRFPPNFVRQLSTKARRNCSNIGVAQVVAASWSNNPAAGGVPSAASATAVDAAATAAASAPVAPVEGLQDGAERLVVDDFESSQDVQLKDLDLKEASFLSSDGSLAIHAGERLGRGIVTDAITTPVVNTSAYFFKKTAELIDFKEMRHTSFEYGRYGNPTTVVVEEKISALEGAESTLVMASGMCASTVMLMALVPAGGHIVTTTDCYRKTRIFIETFLPKMGISATVIDPADTKGLETALEEYKVSLFFTESPTNPFLRCVDIKLVSDLCHKKGALVCIDGTFATPLNQKALALGADLVLHSATKFSGMDISTVRSGYLVGNATPVMPPSSAPASQTIVVRQSSSSQMTVQPLSGKRKVANTAPEGPSGGKRSRGVLSSTSKRLPIRSSQVIEVENNQQAANLTALKVSPQNNAASIAKRLFYPPLHSTPTKLGPTTPPQGTCSRSDKSASSSMETLSVAECSNSNTNTPEGITLTHRTVVSYEKITVSPFKQIIERGHCISSSSPAKRVKGRLDFNDSIPEVSTSLENEIADNTSTSESEKEIDIFDLDFPNLDVFGANFSLSELLVDFDLDGGDIDHSCGAMMEASDGIMAGLSHEPRENNLGTDQLMAEYSAAQMEIHSEKDIQIQDVNNVRAVKSMTRCTSVLSPVKNPGASMHQ